MFVSLAMSGLVVAETTLINSVVTCAMTLSVTRS